MRLLGGRRGLPSRSIRWSWGLGIVSFGMATQDITKYSALKPFSSIQSSARIFRTGADGSEVIEAHLRENRL